MSKQLVRVGVLAVILVVSTGIIGASSFTTATLERSTSIDVVADGIERGVFRDVDPESAATLILTLDLGHIVRVATRDDDPTAALEPELRAYVDDRLMAEQSATA
jgi:hypothetical protein